MSAGAGAEIRAMVQPGATFDTHLETGIVVVTALVGASGGFVGRNQDGEECAYHVDLITRITPAAGTSRAVCGFEIEDGNRDDPSHAYCGLPRAHAGDHGRWER